MAIKVVKIYIAVALLFLTNFVYADQLPVSGPSKDTIIDKIINLKQEVVDTITQEISFNSLILAAQKQAELDNPTESLKYYQKALEVTAHNPTEKRIALFGIAKMNLWLGNYEVAKKIYQQLQTELLSSEDQKIVEAGLEKIRFATESKPMQEISNPQATKSLVNIETSVNKEFDETINAAQKAASSNDPQKSLNYYEQALKLVGNDEVRKRIASFGIAKMQLWLENYQLAKTIYQQLLQETLNAEDRKVAKEGLEKANLALAAPSAKKLSPEFDEAISAAQKAASNNDPKQSLKDYEHALKLAGNDEVKKRVASFGLAKMQLWLENYQTAKIIYQQLLQENLNEEDRKVAKQGLEKANLALTLPAKKQQAAEQETYFDILIKQARQYINTDQPKKALQYYRQALSMSQGDPTKQRVALFGIGRVSIWLGNYGESERVYRQLLGKPLDYEDYQVALAGYVQTLSDTNRPIKAYRQVPTNFVYTDAELAVIVAQAALWAGWPDKAVDILDQNQKLIESIDIKSALAKRLNILESNLALVASPNRVAPLYHFETDSDHFELKRYLLSYAHKFTDVSTTQITVGQNSYFLAPDKRLGNVISLRNDWRITDFLNTSAQGGTVSFKGWEPFLWNIRALFYPNDYIQFSLDNFTDLVETIPAIDNNITYNSSDAALQLYPTSRLNLYANYFNQKFSDSNIRRGIYASGSFLLSNYLGLQVRALMRKYNNSIPNSPYYFSPEKYQSNVMLLELRRKFRGYWQYYINGGLGRQYIFDTPSTPTHQYEMGFEGPLYIKHLYFYTNYGYSTASSSETGFSWHYGNVGISWVF